MWIQGSSFQISNRALRLELFFLNVAAMPNNGVFANHFPCILDGIWNNSHIFAIRIFGVVAVARFRTLALDKPRTSLFFSMAPSLSQAPTTLPHQDGSWNAATGSVSSSLSFATSSSGIIRPLSHHSSRNKTLFFPQIQGVA